MRSESEQAAATIRGRVPQSSIDLGLVLGTGLAAIAEQVIAPLYIPYRELAGFPQAVAGENEPELVPGTARVAVLKGRALYHETRDMAAMRVPLEVLKLLGADGSCW